jgi:2,2-dialkylglycine decarboxylase (pyruvate)
MDAKQDGVSLSLWEQGGEHLLVLQPFMDSLIVRGEGCHLIDADGRRILDLAAGQFCSILGHNHQRFISRLQQQLDALVHLGDQYVSPGVLEAAARLAAITPGALDKVIFLSTGSEANECAMRIAKTVTGRTALLAFTRGYYGISLATRNLSAISDHPGKVDFQPAPVNQYKLLTPACSHCPIGLEHPSCNVACLDVSLELIAQHLENVAAVIIEPILSAGGMIFPPKDYVHKLYETAHKIGALFIVDEAQTGFGRCGQWFDIQNYELEPDILIVSKTAGNGYPAAAVIVSQMVARELETQGFSHLSSHQNDPLAAAAVHAVIDIVEEENLIAHSRQIGGYFVEQLKSLQQKHDLIVDVRGRGLMIGLELTGKFQSSQQDNVAFALALLCEQRGVHVTFSYFEPVIRFIPPLIITSQEIEQAVAVLDNALTILQRGSINVANLLPKNKRSGPYIRRMNERFSPSRVLRGMWNTAPRRWVEKLKKTL